MRAVQFVAANLHRLVIDVILEGHRFVNNAVGRDLDDAVRNRFHKLKVV